VLYVIEGCMLQNFPGLPGLPRRGPCRRARGDISAETVKCGMWIARKGDRFLGSFERAGPASDLREYRHRRVALGVGRSMDALFHMSWCAPRKPDRTGWNGTR